MDEEIKIAFELAYLPVAHARNRLNGQDFIGVAVPIMDYVRSQTTDSAKIRKAAKTMVLVFNDMLNPKLPNEECENMVDLLCNNGELIRMIAKRNQEEV